MSHGKVLEACEEIGIRPSVIRLLAGYLYDQRTIVKWEQVTSGERPALAGCGQGTILSVLLFIITINIMIRRLKKRIAKIENDNESESLRPTTTVRCFVDDLSLLN